MTGVRYIQPYGYAYSQSGAPIPGAELHFFITQSNTEANTYADADLSVPNPNPVIADASGTFPNIFLDPAILYKVTQSYPQQGAIPGPIIWTADPVTVAGGEFSGPGGAGMIGVEGGGTVQDALDDISHGTAWINVPAPTNGPTTAVNAVAGNLNGIFYYRVSYVNPDGETDVSLPSAAVSPANQQVNISNIPVSSDPSVTGRKIYRSVANETEPARVKLLTTITDNAVTDYTDNIPDASLGVMAPYYNSTGGGITINGVTVAKIGVISTKFGNQADPNETGYACSSFGANALGHNTNGFRNSAFGVDALEHNTIGYNNTAVGVHALGACTTSTDNTAVGLSALESATSGPNTAVGSSAGAFTTTGVNNTFIGTTCGLLNTTGNHNTGVGHLAIANLTSATGNTAIGYQAGVVITTGSFNSFFGFQSGQATTVASSNVGVGQQSLFTNSIGSGNVAIGPSAGFWETGDLNLWIDNQPRTDLTDARAKALVVGKFGATVDQQYFSVNGQLISKGGLTFGLTPNKAANYTMLPTDQAITITAAVIITLLPAASVPGRTLIVRTTNFPLQSASANVIPLAGGAPAIAILAAVAGKWAFLMSDGTNWQIMMAN